MDKKKAARTAAFRRVLAASLPLANPLLGSHLRDRPRHWRNRGYFVPGIIAWLRE
jgi:hypothetical protein